MRTLFIILLIIFFFIISFVMIQTQKSNHFQVTAPSTTTLPIEENSSSAHLIFKATFDDGTSLFPPDRKGTKIWWQDIKGTQSVSSRWPKERGEASFQMIVNRDNINDYIENRIEETIGINNKKTKALHQIVKKKEHPWSQVPYRVYTNDIEENQLYIRYALKLPKNLSKLLGKEGWVALSEFKTVSDYRVALYIYKNKYKDLYWFAHGDNTVLENASYKEYWNRDNKKIPVRTGEWMDIEIFWKRAKDNNGQVWLAVDGKTVINYHGSTKINDPIRIIMLFTNYASVPLDQWIDNIEVWDNFPCEKEKSCH
jgi:hypothetical protein